MTTREEAIKEMPSLVGTPGTIAYKRSNEACAKWYMRHYKTICKALSPSPDEVMEAFERIVAAGSPSSLTDGEYYSGQSGDVLLVRNHIQSPHSSTGLERPSSKREVSGSSPDAEANKWQPIESAPKDGTEILGYNQETEHIWLAHWETLEKGWFHCIGNNELDPLTHWMPLPKPPHTREGMSEL